MTQRSVSVCVHSGPHAGRMQAAGGDLIRLGRDPRNDIALEQDTTVSQFHAEIFFDGERWFVRDCDSKNGTLVEPGAIRTTRDMPVPITPGQSLLLGSTRVCFNVRLAMPEGISTLAPLQLRIAHDGEQATFQLSARGSAVTQYSVRLRSSDTDELNHRLRNLAVTAGLDGNGIGVGRSVSEELREAGVLIRDHFVPPRLHDKLMAAKGAALLLVHDPAALSMPWELALIEDEPWCLAFELGRQVVLRDQSVHRQVQREARMPHLLMIANPTGDLLEEQAEAEVFFEHLRRTYPDVATTYLAAHRVTRLELLRNLEHADAVYYIGHAEHDTDPARRGWVLKDGYFTADDVSRLEAPPSLVFANACESGRATISPESRFSVSGSSGVATSFALSGVEHYLGSVWPIKARSGSVFASAFFRACFAGETLGSSVREARKQLLATAGPGDPAWASYVLYGDPTANLSILPAV